MRIKNNFLKITSLKVRPCIIIVVYLHWSSVLHENYEQTPNTNPQCIRYTGKIGMLSRKQFGFRAISDIGGFVICTEGNLYGGLPYMFLIIRGDLNVKSLDV